MAAALPVTISTYTCTGNEQNHTFDADMKQAWLCAKDTNVDIGNVSGTREFPIMSGTTIFVQNKNWAGRTLYFSGTLDKIFAILEDTAIS